MAEGPPRSLTLSRSLGVMRAELRVDAGPITEVRDALRWLWHHADDASDVHVVLLVIDGDPADLLEPGDLDADPTIGPRSLGLPKPVVVLARTPLPSALFGLVPEAVRVFATDESGLLEGPLGQASDLPRASGLDIPYQAMAELSLRGRLTATRAKAVGLFHDVGSDAAMTEAAEHLANALAESI